MYCPQISAKQSRLEAEGNILIALGKKRHWCGAALLVKQNEKEEPLSAFNRGKEILCFTSENIYDRE